MAYKHGAYGEIMASKVTDAKQSNVVAAYIGTAPINLIRGYAEKDLVNRPIKIESMSDAQSKLGYNRSWGVFTLCEAFAAHFDNPVGNVGPIYVVNVLDPDEHKTGTKDTMELNFVNQRAEFQSENIILDSFAIADKVEGVDYALEYDFAKSTVVVKLLKADDTETLQCSYHSVIDNSVLPEEIIGQTTEDGQYTGLHAFKLLYQQYNVVLNILAAPYWSYIPEVYKAMVSTVQKLNGHWDGFVNADLRPGTAGTYNINGAIEWKETNGYNSEFSKVYWPMVKDGSGRIFHLSTMAQVTMMRTDLSHDGVPFESPSNKEIMATCQYFSNGDAKGFDQQEANRLNEKGITTACFWGGKWVLWGPHTAAYTYNGNMDGRAIFDVNMRMLMHITNSFQLDHGTKIDSPMTPQDRDTILNAEREKLDTLTGIGALIGTPTVAFLETENTEADIMNGDFVWDFDVTNTPPFKSGTARVRYTEEGFASFFETA